MHLSKDQLRLGQRAAAAVHSPGPAGVSRRRFLTLGGFSVATAALVAACGSDDSSGQIPQGGLLPTSTALPAYPVSDLALVRTASSIEHNLVDAYAALASLGTVSPEALDLMAVFSDHHTDHARVFEQATAELGGNPFTRANPVFYTNAVEPGLQLLADTGNSPQSVYRFAHGLETVAGAMYQQIVPTFTTPELRSTAMSVGGVEAMHSALWVPFIDEGAVSPALVAAEEGGTTTAAVAGPTSLPVYMVPATFGQVDPVDVQLGATVDSIDIPGPNTYMYPELGE